MNIAYPDGSVVVDYPLIESEVVQSLAERIVVDNGAIRIDSAPHNLDKSHLVLDGVLESGQSYFKITKSGTTLVNCDHTGKLFCNADVTGPNIVALETEMADSTNVGTHDTLVRRNNNTTTTIQDLTSDTIHTNVIEVQTDVALYGDRTLTYTPQDANTGFNIIPAYTYRFGANSAGVGDFTTRGDGLEMKEPDDPVTGDPKNKCVIQVNSQTPTIELLVNKLPGESFFLVRDKTLQPVLHLDAAGTHIRTETKAIVNVTPGNAVAVTTLTEGMQSHYFVLSTAWGVSTSETEIEFEESVVHSNLRVIQNLEVLLDDIGTGSAVESRLYIKRWGVYRHTKQKLWLVLGVDFRNGETQLASSSDFRVSFNNKVVIS